MRYIGNKTKLLGFISGFLSAKGIDGGSALDAFAGTASVSRFLKQRGFNTATCDILSSSYAFQRAYVVNDAYPQFVDLRDEAFLASRKSAAFSAQVESRFGGQGELFGVTADLRPLEEVLIYLDTFLEPQAGFVTQNFSSGEGGLSERMYFTTDNASRIDAIRNTLHKWAESGQIGQDEFYVVLAALLEASDRVANTTGVYAAFVKTWQANARKNLTLALPELVVGTGLTCSAYQEDVLDLAAELSAIDLVYLDPPYNTRQYAGYYHIPELLAEGWFEVEPTLRGKTGLIPDQHKKSQWSTREGCVPALEKLVSSLKTRHLVLSYNNEGIIPESEIERIFKSYGRKDTYERVGKNYSRYKADAEGPGRRYTDDSTTEFLYYVSME